MKKSAGIMIYRSREAGMEVILVHSNGREDLEAWSLPKGEFDPEVESPAHAAVREVNEELGIMIPESELQDLGQSTFRNKSKRVFGFSWKAPDEELRLTPDPHEIEKVEYFGFDEARRKLHEAQKIFLDRLVEHLQSET